MKHFFSEQTGLLKTEIRRLEKNQERKDNIHNLEYLKNVILKFMTLQPGTEKTGLIPVLETMLQVKIFFLIISRFGETQALFRDFVKFSNFRKLFS